MPTDEGAYAIGDLAGLAGTTPRTIRYYVAQGLLPAPVGSGPGAHYTDGHLARLRLIRRLQRQHQPLSAIRQRLASLGESDVAALLAVAEAPQPAPGDSALDYVRSILGPASPGPTATSATALPGMEPALPTPVAAATPVAPSAPVAPVAPSAAPGGPARLLRQLAMPRMRDLPPAPAAVPARQPAEVAVEAMVVPAPAVDAAVEQRSQWDRIGITPNIEIHVRRPLSRLENRRVERLITIARQVLREEQP